MSRKIDDLASVLRALTDWNSSKEPPLDQQVESLRLIVAQMATAMALHEVQITKLREAIVLLTASRE